MPRKPLFALFAIPREQVEGMGVEELLDMLRYDGAVPQSNAPEGHYLFRAEGKYMPEHRRWASMGVRDLILMDPDYPRDVSHGSPLIAARAGYIRS